MARKATPVRPRHGERLATLIAAAIALASGGCSSAGSALLCLLAASLECSLGPKWIAGGALGALVVAAASTVLITTPSDARSSANYAEQRSLAAHAGAIVGVLAMVSVVGFAKSERAENHDPVLEGRPSAWVPVIKALSWIGRWVPDVIWCTAIAYANQRSEPELRSVVAKCEPGITAVDVGVWYGPWSYWLTRRVDHVIAFEPNPDVRRVSRSGPWKPTIQSGGAAGGALEQGGYWRSDRSARGQGD